MGKYSLLLLAILSLAPVKIKTAYVFHDSLLLYCHLCRNMITID